MLFSYPDLENPEIWLPLFPDSKVTMVTTVNCHNSLKHLNPFSLLSGLNHLFVCSTSRVRHHFSHKVRAPSNKNLFRHIQYDSPSAPSKTFHTSIQNRSPCFDSHLLFFALHSWQKPSVNHSTLHSDQYFNLLHTFFFLWFISGEDNRNPVEFCFIFLLELNSLNNV